MEPLDHFERVNLIFPSLVGVDGDRSVRNGANGLDHFSVALLIATELDFKEFKARRFFSFLLNDVGFVDSDRVHRRRGLFLIESPNAPPWLTNKFPNEVVQRQVNRSLGGGVVFANSIDVTENVFHLERTFELTQIDAAQKRQDGFRGFA